jgi:transcriptional regulator with XRE-family HTH domain
VAANLARILHEKEISQTELARRVGVSFQTINGYAKGRAGISGDMIAKLAVALEVEETALTTDPYEMAGGKLFAAWAQDFAKELGILTGEKKEEFRRLSQRGLMEFMANMPRRAKPGQAMNEDEMPDDEPLLPALSELLRVASALDEHELATLLEIAQGLRDGDAETEAREARAKAPKRR